MSNQTKTHEEKVAAAKQKVEEAKKRLALLEAKNRKADARTKILAGTLLQSVVQNSDQEFMIFITGFAEQFFSKRPADAEVVLAYLTKK